MSGEPGQIIQHLTERLWILTFEDYLSSEEFSRFCRDHDLVDEWQGILALSRDTPHLYGNMMTKNAFAVFLHHLFEGRTKEFPTMLVTLLAGFSRKVSRPLPLDDIKKDLVHLGYSDQETEYAFSGMNAGIPESRPE